MKTRATGNPVTSAATIGQALAATVTRIARVSSARRAAPRRRTARTLLSRAHMAALGLIVPVCTTALLTVPAAQGSTSAPRSGAAASVLSGGHAVAIPLRLTPGTHTLSRAIPVAARPAIAALGGQHWVDIRVGKNDCGGYKGVVYWGASSGIEATGTLWDNCNYYTPNTTVYLYVRYNDIFDQQNADMAQVSGVTNTVSIDAYTLTAGAPPTSM